MVNIYLLNICMFILRKLDLCVVALCVLYTECSTKQVLMQTIDLYLILFYSRYRIIFWINLFIEFFQSTCLPIVMQFEFFPIIIECRCSYKPFEYEFFWFQYLISRAPCMKFKINWIQSKQSSSSMGKHFIVRSHSS